MIHPALRERFLEDAANEPLVRLYYEADDGWRAPLFVIPPAPGGSGEPVVLAHALGVAPDAYRYGRTPSLASALSRAGFTVYLLSHRGDRAAFAPESARGFDIDDIVERDLPAALERIREHSGFPLVHAVGHGLGGQLWVAWAGRSRSESLATVTALCTPVTFDRPRSEARRAAVVTRLMPGHWQIPTARLGPLLAPLVGDTLPVAASGSRAGCYQGDRLRGVMSRAGADLPVGVLRQVADWLRRGVMTDRTGFLDYVEACHGAEVPLMVVQAEDDRLAPPRSTRRLLEQWAHDDVEVLTLPEGWGHLGPLVGVDATTHVFEPICAWLDHRRRLAWRREGSVSTSEADELPAGRAGSR